MSIKTKKIVSEALSLSAVERLNIVDNLLLSLDKPDPEIDKLWQKEAESRLHGYKTGKIKSISLLQALSKYRKAKAA